MAFVAFSTIQMKYVFNNLKKINCYSIFSIAIIFIVSEKENRKLKENFYFLDRLFFS